MNHAVTVLAATITLTIGFAVYRLGPWSYTIVDDISPLVRTAIGVGSIIAFVLGLEQRRTRRFARDAADIRYVLDDDGQQVRS